MAKNADLSEAMQTRLEENGVLGEIRAQIRAQVVQAVRQDDSEPQRRLSSYEGENYLINELIKEYLKFNGLNHTLETLHDESGHPRLDLGREALEAQLKVETGPNARRVPLLYSLVSNLTK